MRAFKKQRSTPADRSSLAISFKRWVMMKLPPSNSSRMPLDEYDIGDSVQVTIYRNGTTETVAIGLEVAVGQDLA